MLGIEVLKYFKMFLSFGVNNYNPVFLKLKLWLIIARFENF